MTAIITILLIFRIGVTIGYWKLFEKANVEGWKSLIPIYSEYWLIKIVGKPIYWVLYLFIPILNIFTFYVLIFDLLRCFGKNSLMSQFLIIFIGPVYIPYIGFKKDVTYLGKLNELKEEKKICRIRMDRSYCFCCGGCHVDSLVTHGSLYDPYPFHGEFASCR